MILRPEQIRLMRQGCPVIPANGGGSKSDSSTSSNTSNTNFVTTEDKRVVASDAAIALSGSGNVASRTENTTFTDYSAKNSGNTTSTSNSFTDSSDRSIHNTTTDFGSVGKSLDMAGATARSAIGLADSSVLGAIDSLNLTGSNMAKLAMEAFKATNTTTRDVISFASTATAKTNEAYARAAEGPDTNKTVMYAALAAVGIVGVMAFAKR